VIYLDISDTTAAARWDETELFRYVYRPDDPVVESPRPYLHPVRTLGGDLVTIFRPHDHVWHKGISLALPNVGPHNFWGGPTYRRGDGYVQLPNNGTQRHDAFDEAVAKDDTVTLAERLTWLAQDGAPVFEESRRIAATAWPADGAWLLGFETIMTNISGAELRIGSPTTEGRENAGYGGLFWRGPRSFTGGSVLTPSGAPADPDAAMGTRGSWLAFTGQHDATAGRDETARHSTLIFSGDPADGRVHSPGQWFVRSTPFAAVCPAPFFAEEHRLVPGGMLTARYVIAVCDGARSTAVCGRLAGRVAETAFRGVQS
jgi:hypothetical protein